MDMAKHGTAYRIMTLAIIVLGTIMVTTAKAAPVFDRMVVFGDSLSDSGNAGRFSNGPVWVEQLANRLGLTLKPSRMGGTNFAVGGAHLNPGSGSDSVRAQADAYLKSYSSPAGTLYVVFGGGNDLLSSVGFSHGEALIDAAVASLAGIVADLIERGATDILVPNLPDIGITPEVRAHGPQAVENASKLTGRFNATLDRALARFAGIPSLRLYRLDVEAIAERVRGNPAALGFVDITTSCNTISSCDGYLFWDGVHPTTQAHDKLAGAAFQTLSER